MVACTCDPSTREVEEGEAEIQGHLQLFREFAVTRIRICETVSNTNKKKKSDQKGTEVVAS